MSTDYKNTPEDAAHFLKLVEKMTNPDQTPSDDPQIAIVNGDTEPDPVQIAEAGPAVADLEKIKELRKLLAGLLLEFRK